MDKFNIDDFKIIKDEKTQWFLGVLIVLGSVFLILGFISDKQLSNKDSIKLSADIRALAFLIKNNQTKQSNLAYIDPQQLNIDVQSRTDSASDSGSVDINGINIDLNRNTGGTESVDITAPGGAQRTIDATNDSLRVQSSSGGIDSIINLQTNQDQTSILRDVNGNAVNINLAPGSLDISVQGAIIDESSKQVIVNLEGNAVTFINSEEDLEVYNKIVIEERPSIQEVKVEVNSVRIDYVQPARFLGIFSTTLSAEVDVDNRGFISIELPWYSFLYTKNTKEIKLEIQQELALAKESDAISINIIGNSGSVNTSVSGSGSGVDIGVSGSGGNATRSIQAKNNAKVVNVVTSVVDRNVSLSVSGSRR